MTRMTPRDQIRFALACVLLAFLGGSAGTLVTSQVLSSYLGPKAHVGDNAPIVTAAQFQVLGPEGGIALVTRDAAGENFIMGVQPFNTGGPMGKLWSTSGLVLDHDMANLGANAYAGYRINAAFKTNGAISDNVQAVFCGGHGIVLNPISPKADGECPGWMATRVNGRLSVDELWVAGRRVQ